MRYSRLVAASAATVLAIVTASSLTFGSASASTRGQHAGIGADAPSSQLTALGSTAAASPNCGKGVSARKVLARYSAKRYRRGGYRTDVMYCGNSNYGYRHLAPHVGQYFGGWGSFSFAVAQVLKVPAVFKGQTAGTGEQSSKVWPTWLRRQGRLPQTSWTACAASLSASGRGPGMLMPIICVRNSPGFRSTSRPRAPASGVRG